MGAMSDQLPEHPAEGGQQPSGHAFGDASATEPTQPVAPQTSFGFGTQQQHQPGYQQPGYQQPGYQQHGQAGYGFGQAPYDQSASWGSYQQPGQQQQTSQQTGQQPGHWSLPPQAPAQPVATRERKRRGPVMVASLALAAMIGAGAGIGSYAFLDHGSTSVASPIGVSTQQAPQQAKTNGTIEAAAKRIQPSVVTITVVSGSSGDIGSGIVLDKQGHILTNNHVVASLSQDQSQGGGFGGAQQSGTSKITVTFSDGRTATAKVVGTDETDDLAVIKVDGVSNLTPATFAKTSSLSVGQSVVAVGAPLGLSQTVTSGIVSNVARPVRSGENNDAVYMAVQTDAAINPGNSGGPLVDLNGSVVGIDSSIASTSDDSGSDSQSGNIGIGFAIPSDVAVRIASQLIDTGKSSDAVLGVTISGTDDSELSSTTTGVALQTVQPNSAAAKAGLQKGDVVTALNGFKVTTADGLIAATHYYAPGTKVTVTYRRGGQTRTTQATLGSQ
ncbi:peptidase S1 [Microlunatus endophyticus]|uniref:Peptidase S1 n=2 Tax=Microlunatus endophyticus TaxID=1716077 RepID=A0A917W7V8_9ACTN|nr:peptidase S1 [Microlunatus endophyticus]